MARLVTKFKYLKSTAKKTPGKYAKYIATREGVEKIDDSQKLAPVTEKQKRLVKEILRDYPESVSTLEYDDYLTNPTRGNASEFIVRALEDHADENMTGKTYADYIATRPRAERIGSHGLFTDEGVPVKLSRVSEELNHHDGNIWTAIVSLRREDAERLGYDSGERWRQMLRAQTQEFSDQLHIPMKDLRWYGAFHNEGHHPHVHLIIYSTNPREGYLSKQGIENLRSSIAREIFHQDLVTIYEKQTENRDAIRSRSRDLVSEIVSQINGGVYHNPVVEYRLRQLADLLTRTGGRRNYKYLKPEVKEIVDSIVSDLASDHRIESLYELWYQQREEIIRTYTEDIPERISLVDNNEFRPIKNIVIQEALRIAGDRHQIAPQEDDQPQDEEGHKSVLVQNVGQMIRDYTDNQTDQEGHHSASRTRQSASGSHFAEILSATRLLHHLSRILQDQIDKDKKRNSFLDRKLKRKIDEKKQAQGIKQ